MKWRGRDSNPRTLRGQIYSLVALAGLAYPSRGCFKILEARFLLLEVGPRCRNRTYVLSVRSVVLLVLRRRRMRTPWAFALYRAISTISPGMVLAAGIEPTTSSVSTRRSATEPSEREWTRKGSNLQPPLCESGALPLSHSSRSRTPTGFEPVSELPTIPTSAVLGLRGSRTPRHLRRCASRASVLARRGRSRCSGPPGKAFVKRSRPDSNRRSSA